ncbi:carbohydrate ABC transporter permease [Streptosporangium subroseum]|jgi:N,N'-diacetylchitobiose transport system permease protein|uniref:N,N'-diacetylchitobiose transport system permease protein n=1 Tax=Streptosporangium subroseum TaxID=106412 RepID=A0A239KZ44_9ACTN|nr:carbohydrate ABC transporter permease [Streptosporangium subroseum]SNT22534.1 N,N'-diacetylchitobiose transport system permease protein [Streptosporangium subroseum]
MRPRRVLLNLAALGVLAVSVFPVYWMVLTAFKPTTDILSETPTFWPAHPTLEHFTTAVGTPGFWTFWGNSLSITVGAVLLALVVALLAAFAVARMRWRGRRAFILMVFIAQMAPWEALLVSMYIVARDTGMLDKLSMLTLIYFMTTLPFTIVTLRGFIAAIPPELEEAAQMDGCSRTAAFRRVVLPLLAPGLMSTSLFGFITAWNEFAFANALIIKNQADRTLPVWLSSFSNVFGTDWGATMAAATLFMLPVLAIFLVLQRRVTSGLIAGAVKG